MKKILEGVVPGVLDDCIDRLLRVIRDVADNDEDFRRVYNELGTAMIEGEIMEIIIDVARKRHENLLTEIRKNPRLSKYFR